MSIIILPLQHADVAACAKMSGAAFLGDRHTELKEHGKIPYDHAAKSVPRLHSYLDNHKVVAVKAVSEGTIVGHVEWVFRGLDADEIPYPDGCPERVPERDWEAGGEKGNGEGEEEKENDEGLKLLANITDGNMTDMMTNLMPSGTRCMFIVGLTVDPQHQRRGVGKALLKYGTNIADSLGLMVWVHSSQGALPAYASAGFKPFAKLEVVLDEFAAGPPPEGGLWGSYAWQWMWYHPNGTRPFRK
ncbi:putative GNAT family acetyltransferase [Calycina marina]|uniref:GNAT family acetyltransferase n=1 Tax=Calycina marina TaxID=1763456 RepID=A0A9P7YV75_9HELO|nr:putative GNAT family acetyltransferase [Calycina marina]